jgi:hypothetical protein
VRFAAVFGLSAVLIVTAAVYSCARTGEDSRIAAILARAEEQAEASPRDPEDAADGATVHQLLATRKLTENQITQLIVAAGRRYIRRKVAYEEASAAVEAGRAPAASLDPLRRDADFARKVCDFAESIGRHDNELAEMAMTDIMLERMLAYGGAGVGLGLVDRNSGSRDFTDADLKQLREEFQSTFGRALPVSAKGQTALHNAMGFNHRGRVDVAVFPSGAEGVWVRRYLTGKGITYFAFSSAVRGKATGAHIHIGPPSGRLAHGD